MSCGCGNNTQSGNGYPNPCNTSAPVCDPTNEPTASVLNNFILAFFGEVVKVCNADNEIEWTLPCDLDEGIDGWPRVVGEGLACYFKRIFEAAIIDILPGLIEAPTDKAYTIARGMPYGGIINSVAFGITSGDLELTIAINGTPVTGLSSVAVAATGSAAATAANAFAAGDVITLEVANSNSPVDFDFTISYDKRP